MLVLAALASVAATEAGHTRITPSRQVARENEPLTRPSGSISIWRRSKANAGSVIINQEHSGCFAFYGKRVHSSFGYLVVDFQGGVDCPIARKHKIKMRIKIEQTKLIRPRPRGKVLAETGERAADTTFLEGPIGSWEHFRDTPRARRLHLRVDLRAALTVYQDSNGNPAVWSVPPDGCQFPRGGASGGSDTVYCYWFGPEFLMRPKRG
jgi:hypothetical protein